MKKHNLLINLIQVLLSSCSSKIISLSVLLLLTSCGGDDEVPVPGNNNPPPGNQNPTDPSFSDLGFGGETVSIIDIAVNNSSTITLLSDGSVWAIGFVTNTNSFVKIYENAKAIGTGCSHLVAIITNDGKLVTTSVVDNGFDEIATNVIDVAIGFGSVQSSLPDIAYITADNILWLPLNIMDALGIAANQVDAYQPAFNNVQAARITRYESSSHLVVLKTDGTLWETLGGFIDRGAASKAELDAYYSFTDGPLYQVATDIVEMDIGQRCGAGNSKTLALNTNGELLISARESNERWFSIPFDPFSLNLADYLEYDVYPGLSNLKATVNYDNEYFIIDQDNNLLVTGNDGTSQHGDGIDRDKSSFTQVYQNVEKVAVNTGHSIILLEDGSLKGSGANTRGQLADGTTIGKNDFDQVNTTSAGGGDDALLGTWSISNGSTITFNSDGTGEIVQVDEFGICNSTKIPITWSTSGPTITITNGSYTICKGTDMEFAVTTPESSTVNYTVSGNTLTLNGQPWTR